MFGIIPLVDFVQEKDAPAWGNKEKKVINEAMWDVAKAYAQAYNIEITRRYYGKCENDYPNILQMLDKIDPYTAYITLHAGRITFKRLAIENVAPNGDETWAQAYTTREIWIYANADEAEVSEYKMFAVHEIGHAFENALEGALGSKLGRDTLAKTERGDYLCDDLWVRHADGDPNGGFAGGQGVWQWNTGDGADYRHEIFADMFVGWVYGKWARNDSQALTPLGARRSSFMSSYMPGWIVDAIQARGRRN